MPKSLIKFFGFLVGRKDLHNSLQKRTSDKFIVRSCGISEFVIQALFIFSGTKLLSRNLAAKIGWFIYGLESRRFIKDADILFLRSGAGRAGIIKKARKKGIKIITDHSIAHPNEIFRQLDKSTNGSDFQNWKEKKDFWQYVLKDCSDSDKLVVNSEYVRETFINEGFDGEKTLVVPLGIRSQFWDIKKDYSIKGGTIKLLFTGQYGFRKGAPVIEEALQLLRSSKVDCAVEVFGALEPGYPVKDLRGIIHHGFVDQTELFNGFRKSDIYIFPSYCEGSAQSLKEAMAAGLPVIATKQSGAPIIHGVNGLLIEAGSAAALAEAVMILLNDEVIRREIGRAAFKTIQVGHTWDNYSRQIYDIFEKEKNKKCVKP